MPDDVFLVGAAAGSLLTLAAIALGWAELRHQRRLDRLAGHGQDLTEHPTLGTVTKPGRW
jgi:hypothetical protein